MRDASWRQIAHNQLNVSPPGFAALSTTVRNRETDLCHSTCQCLNWMPQKRTGSCSFNINRLPIKSKRYWLTRHRSSQMACFLYIPFLIRPNFSELVVGDKMLKCHIILSCIQLYCLANTPSPLFLSQIVNWCTHARTHAGPTLLMASLNHRYYNTGCCRVLRSVTHACITCRGFTAKPKPQLLGQIPVERITPDSVFNRVGLDYAGPFILKYGLTCKPSFNIAYVACYGKIDHL